MCYVCVILHYNLKKKKKKKKRFGTDLKKIKKEFMFVTFVTDVNLNRL